MTAVLERPPHHSQTVTRDFPVIAHIDVNSPHLLVRDGKMSLATLVYLAKQAQKGSGRSLNLIHSFNLELSYKQTQSNILLSYVNRQKA